MCLLYHKMCAILSSVDTLLTAYNRSISEVFSNTIFREILVANRPGWSASNPSIARGPDGYRFTIRSSNYVLDASETSYYTKEGVIETINYVGQMDKNLRVTGLDRIYTALVEGPILYPWVLGVEDCRIWWDIENDIWKTSGSYRQHRSDGVTTIAVDSLDGALVVKREVLTGNNPDQFEKNWMPTGRGNDFLRGPWGNEMQLRGSSEAVPIGDDYYGVLHYVTYDTGRRYWHCFSKFNSSGGLLGISEPFYFINPGVEFANGMTVWQDNFVVTFSNRDERALMVRVPISDVMDSI